MSVVCVPAGGIGNIKIYEFNFSVSDKGKRLTLVPVVGFYDVGKMANLGWVNVFAQNCRWHFYERQWILSSSIRFVVYCFPMMLDVATSMAVVESVCLYFHFESFSLECSCAIFLMLFRQLLCR